jgi:hypothetical protein
MSVFCDYDEPHASFNKSCGSNSYCDWLSPTCEDSSRLDDDDVFKEQEYWKNLVRKALKQGNDESVVSSTQDESEVSIFSLGNNPDLEKSFVWSVPMLPIGNPTDSSIEPEKCEAESSFSSTPSSLAKVPFVSLDISLEEPTTTSPLIHFDHDNKPRLSHVASTQVLPLSIPSYIYISPTGVNATSSEPELLDIYDPTELQLYQSEENSWPEPVHRLHRLLLQYSQSSFPNDDNRQRFLTDILSCIQEHPETCQIRYPLPRPVFISQATFCDSGYYFPLTYFCLTNCLEGAQVAYQACPEVIGCINDPESGWIPLAYACLGSNYSRSTLELIQFLLSVYPDGVRRTTVRTQQTILHSLCHLCPDPQVVRLLLEHYPTAAQLPDVHGYTPVMYLCRNSIPCTTGSQLWPLFWNTSPLTVQAVTPQTMEKLLHIACRYNIHQYALIESILTQDPSQCQYTDRDFQLPIHKAVQGYTELSPDARREARRSIQRLVRQYPEALEWRDDQDEAPRDILLRLCGPASALDAEEKVEHQSLLDLLASDCISNLRYDK